MADKKHYPLAFKCLITATLILLLHYVGVSGAARVSSGGSRKGKWKLLLNNTGVVAMHMALTHRNTVIMFDQTTGRSRYRLRQRRNGRSCSESGHDLEDSSCYAHSVEYKISGNKVRPLRLSSNPWCSAGTFLSNGTLLQIGGTGSGSRRTQYFRPCDDGECNWSQSERSLLDDRWYASSQKLPEHDCVIVVGGRGSFSYEFVPKVPSWENSFDLPFLHQTYEKNAGGNNMYPFLHVSSDGNLFIFANRDSILFNYRDNRVVKTFPRIPGGGSRSYPSTGSSVILPLDHTNRFQKVEVMVCGGAASGAYNAAHHEGRFLSGLRSCGRMVITGNNHEWKMENMPEPRLLNDMLILPTGDILIINGAKKGSAGWNNARNPSLQPYLYKPNKTPGKRFSVLKSTEIPRLYHSSAILLPDGRVLVAGSNPQANYTFRNVAYPTELRLQAFAPHYLDRQFHEWRPSNVTIEYRDGGRNGIRHGREFGVRFWMGRSPSKVVEFSVYAPPFATHSLSMNQRMLKLRCISMVRDDKSGWVNAVLEAPPSNNVAPPGYYLLTVVNGRIPSTSQWVRFIYA